jgi:DNA-binding transcriptional MerR regulator
MRDREPLTGLMTVGQLSRQTGVPIKALRQYTDWGLVYTAGRSPSNYRLFSTDALWCLRQIHQLRGLGLTIAEIHKLATTDDRSRGPLLADHLRRARARLDAQIIELQYKRRRLEEFASRHQTILASQDYDDLWADNPRAARHGA